MFGQQTWSFPFYTCLVIAALLAAQALFLAGRKGRGAGVPAALMVTVVPAAALLGARALYVAFALDDYLYVYGLPAVFDLGLGGCMLYGGIFGALLAGFCLAKAHHVSVGRTLDELVIPGLAAIAICRFAEFFTTEGVGVMMESEAFCFFPLAVMNEYEEWNLAVFLMEGLAALVLLTVMARRRKSGDGEKTLSALLLLSCCQIVLEDLRADGCLRIGFVRVTEVIAAVTVLAVVLIRCRRLDARAMAVRVLGVLLCVGGVGIIEWAEDKTNIPNLLLYIAMAALCAAMAWIGERASQNRREK